MTNLATATVAKEREEDDGRPAIRLLVQEALMVLRQFVMAAESIDPLGAEAELASAHSVASGDTPLSVSAGRVVNQVTDLDWARAMSRPDAANCLSFPPYELDLTNEVLLRDGEEIPLQSKPFCVLRYMAEHPQRLVKHCELKAAIWGPNIISESLLRTHVRALRKALGAGVIETVVGRGYRFMPTVTPATHA